MLRNVKQLDIEYKNRIAAFSKAISPYASGPMKDEMCTAVQNEADNLYCNVSFHDIMIRIQE